MTIPIIPKDLKLIDPPINCRTCMSARHTHNLEKYTSRFFCSRQTVAEKHEDPEWWADHGWLPMIPSQDVYARGWFVLPENVSALEGCHWWQPARWVSDQKHFIKQLGLFNE